MRVRDLLAPTADRAVPCYMWADSSPQGGRDWLLLHLHTIEAPSCEDLLQAAMAHDELASRVSRFTPGAWVHADAIGLDGGSGLESLTDNDDEPPLARRRQRGQQGSACAIPAGDRPLKRPRLRADLEDISFSDGHASSEQEQETPAASAPVDFSGHRSAELTRLMCQAFGYHTPIPGALGNRAGSLSHKAGRPAVTAFGTRWGALLCLLLPALLSLSS